MNTLKTIIKNFVQLSTPVLLAIIPLQIFDTIVERGSSENNSDSKTNGEYFFLQKISTGKSIVIIEAGGHDGTWARVASRYFPHSVIHTFEPASDSFKKLEQAHKENNRFVLNHSGLAAKAGTIELNIYGDESQLNSMYARGHGLVNIKRKEHCTVEMFDEYRIRQHIDRVGYFKIDTEGAEMSILEGAKDTLRAMKIDIVQVEYNDTWIDARTYLKDLFALATTYSYVVAKLYPKHIKILDAYDYRLERFRYSNYLLLRKDLVSDIKACGVKMR